MIYDVSMPIHASMQVYKNKIEKKPIFNIHTNQIPHFTSETELTMNLHTGTHMDFPRHMLKEGSVSTGFSPETFLNKPVKVFDVTHVKDAITKEEVSSLDISSGDIVFFKTKNSMTDEFLHDFAYLDVSAAKALIEKNVYAVGIDGLGIERNDPNHTTHQTLMKAGIWIIEGLRLKDIPAKAYTCIALPINIEGADALPLRVIIYD